MAVLASNSRGGGRPSKGDRHAMKTRVPTPLAQQIFNQAEAEGIYASDLIAELLDEYLPERIVRWQARGQKQDELPETEDAATFTQDKTA